MNPLTFLRNCCCIFQSPIEHEKPIRRQIEMSEFKLDKEFIIREDTINKTDKLYSEIISEKNE